jgi:hypothetical protein
MRLFQGTEYQLQTEHTRLAVEAYHSGVGIVQEYFIADVFSESLWIFKV